MIAATPSPARSRVRLLDSFGGWSERVIAAGHLPIVAVAGSRGKSTVVRILDAVFQAAGLRTATWTSVGVEIQGRRQRGELGAWSRAMGRLTAGTLDVAIQELDWSTVHAVGLPPAIYPVVAVTNLCANNDECLIRAETRLAKKVLPSVLGAVCDEGVLVLNGEDYAVAGVETALTAPALLVAHHRESPLLRGHLSAGGTAAWIQDEVLTVGDREHGEPVCATEDLAFALSGTAAFQIHNALCAGAIARHCGVSAAAIGAVLTGAPVMPGSLPGSFNVVHLENAVAVIDRPTPSWYVRPILRALTGRGRGRLVIVAGRMIGVPDDDLTEVGRLLGRGGDALIVHSEGAEPDRDGRFRQGIAANPVPPVVVHVPTERQALNRALKLLQPGDTLLVFADQPALALRAIQRAAA